MRRKIFSIILIITLLSGFLFVLTGCESGKNGKKGSKLADVVEIGDYVDYDANSGLTTPVTYKTDSTLTGVGSVSEYSSTDEVKWRVLSVDKDAGKVELIATRDLDSLSLSEITGYVNAEEILNGIGAVYGHGKGAAGGRSVNIEDIERYSSYNPEKDYKNSASSNGTVEGTRTYTSGTFIKGEGITGGTESTDDSRVVIASSSNPVTVTQTYYRYSDPSNYFENQKAYDVLLKDRNNFWLASRFRRLYSSDCSFGVRYASSSSVNSCNLYDSDGGTYNPSFGVVPVVSLKSNIQINGKDESGAWNLKVD